MISLVRAATHGAVLSSQRETSSHRTIVVEASVALDKERWCEPPKRHAFMAMPNKRTEKVGTLTGRYQAING